MMGLNVPPRDVAEPFIDKIKQALLSELEFNVTLDNITSPEKTVEPSIKRFLTHFLLFSDSFQGYFLKPTEFQTQMSERDRLKQCAYRPNLSNEERTHLRTSYRALVNLIEDKFIVHIDRIFVLPEDVLKISPGTYLEIFNILRVEVSEMNFSDEHSLSQKMERLIIKVLDRVVSGIFKSVSRDFFARVKEIPPSFEMDILTQVRALTGWIKETLIANVLTVLEAFVNPETASKYDANVDDMVARIKDSVVTFWEDIALEMQTQLAATRVDFSLPHVVLLSKVCAEWSQGVVEAVISMYVERVFIASNQFLADKMEKRIHDTIQSLNNTYKKTSQKLLNRFIQKYMVQIHYEFQKQTVTRGEVIAIQPVAGVSSFWLVVYQNLEKHESLLSKAFDDDSIKRAGETVKKGRATALVKPTLNAKSPSKDKFMVDLDKLFAERLDYLTSHVESSKKAVLNTLCKLIIKVTLLM